MEISALRNILEVNSLEREVSLSAMSSQTLKLREFQQQKWLRRHPSPSPAPSRSLCLRSRSIVACTRTTSWALSISLRTLKTSIYCWSSAKIKLWMNFCAAESAFTKLKYSATSIRFAHQLNTFTVTESFTEILSLAICSSTTEWRLKLEISVSQRSSNSMVREKEPFVERPTTLLLRF